MKTIIAAVLGQIAATCVMIYIPEMYSRSHAGAEAWPVLLPALAFAFALETLAIFMAASTRRGAGGFFKVGLLVLASWIAVIVFFVLDGLDWARPLRPPILAWLASLLVVIYSQRLTRAQ